MSRPLVEVYREVKSRMEWYKDTYFPTGAIVWVKDERYTGVGIVALWDGCPPDQVAVRLENRNVWCYPLEHVEPIPPDVKTPQWCLK